MAALQPLKALSVAARTKHTATVIFVHGLGDTGHGWKPVADMFHADSGLSHVKWVFPHAPVKRVTANMGVEMPSWFDIISFGFDAQEDEEGMLETARALNALITAEVDNGIVPENIVLGGFSQGAAMSVLTGLTTERRLGGVVSLSGWLPLRHKFKAMASAHATSLPLFWGHGIADPLVKFELGRRSVEFLKKEVGIREAEHGNVNGLLFLGYAGLNHSASDKELDDLKGWIKRVLPKSDSD